MYPVVRASAWLVLLCSCQDYQFVYRPYQRVAVTSVREVVVQSADTDVLFVIDNSGSMGEEQDNLRRNTRAFIEELSLSENAFRVGIIDTDGLDDTLAGQDGGRLRMQRAGANDLDDAGCGIGPDASPEVYLERPALDDPELDAKRCRLVEDMAATVESLGTGGSGREAGLLAARLALEPTSPAAADNGDFHRPEADLALVFLTDEEDCSLTTYGDRSQADPECYENLAEAIPVADFVDAFEALKAAHGGIGKVRASLIGGGTLVGAEGGAFEASGCRIDNDSPSAECGCWNASSHETFCGYLVDHGHDCPTANGCELPRCDAMPSGRYSEFIRDLRRRRLQQSFPAGTFEDSICQVEYDDTLLQIARTVVLSDCFTLAEPALGPEAVQILIRSTGGASEDIPVPRIGDSDADCQTCGGCPDGAWRFVDPQTLCLECGLKKEIGQEFVLTVLNELEGVEEP